MSPEPATGSVHLWTVRLDQPRTLVTELDALLDRDERSRSHAFAFERDRRRFIVAHAALREVTGSYCGTDPAAVSFATGANGKPALRDRSLHFNLSHSHDLALVAVARERPVGVDVERLDPGRAVEAVAARFFAPAELAALERLPPARRREHFFRLWTCKESCLKQDGRGIGGIRDVTISFDGEGRAQSPLWSVTELRPAGEYVAAVAVRGSAPAIDCFTWRPSPRPGLACATRSLYSDSASRIRQGGTKERDRGYVG